jgi:putative endopeptidase
MNPPARLLAAALTLACLNLASLSSTGLDAATTPAAAVHNTPSVFAGIDRSVVPGNDFFDYANGAWIKSTTIPPDLPSYGAAEKLIEINEHRVVELIQEAASKPSDANPETRKIADYYAAFMDEARIEARGLSGLAPTMQQINAISDRAALARYLGSTMRADVDILNATNLYSDNLFGLWVAQDLDDPSRYLPFLVQGGLGMPDRDYYLSDSPQMADDRSHYQAYVATVLKLSGENDADQKAVKVFALERSIAQVHARREDSEDVKRGDNHWTREQLASRAPGMDWNAYMDGAGLAHQSEWVIWQPAAVTGIAALVASEPLETWKVYLRFHALSHVANELPKAYVNAGFAFYGKVLNGTPELRERWKRAVNATSGALGDAVGKLYVQHYFSAEAKARIEDLVHNLTAAFSTRIDDLQWMAPQTKAKAKAKLAALKVGVGYPDHWRDYSALEVRRDDALGNAQRAELFEYHRNLAKLGHPVDRSEWVMVPQEVNAVNLPAMNALNFPAAILQPPFFDPNQPAAVNYGSIGATIGHEISHSFDDQGALFDATGRLQNWWTDADFSHFRASATQLVSEFNGYQPFPDLHVNGQQTLSENIADVAGLAAAYSAYQLSLHGKPASVVDGFSGDQQFFLGFAQSWREKSREAALRQQIITDGHAPSQYRAVTCRNLDAWYTAFHVTEGQSLYLPPSERVRMW